MAIDIFNKILDYYHIENRSERANEIRIACPIHKGTNHSSFVWYSTSMSWCCYSQGCQKRYGSSLLGFVKAMESGDEERAKEILENLDIDYQNIQPIRKIKINKDVHFKQENINFNDKHPSYSNYLSRRGIVKGLQEKYKIAIYRYFYPGQICFPIQNLDKRVVGFTLRSLHSNTAFKWIHKPTGFKTSYNLYNIHYAKPLNGSIFIVEGVIDALKLIAGGINNCVATFGCHISDIQIELLKQIGANTVYAAFDNDEAGRTGNEDACALLHASGLEVHKVNLGQYKDFGEMPICLIQRRCWTTEKY